MVKEVYKNIYLNEIDLPKNPLKYLNSYIIKSDSRSLVIDTGFNRPECIDKFFSGLAELDIEPAKIDVLVTHLHSDHCGLIGILKERGAQILIAEQEAKAIMRLSTPAYWDWFNALAKMYDAVKYDIQVSDHPGHRYRPTPVDDYISLQGGDILSYGGYELTIMPTPGHTKGHIALYEPTHKIFFGGDLILDKITPTITFWGFEQDILQVYFDTLQKVEQMDIKLLLTGHRAILHDHKKRIKELREHHEKRLAEIELILAKGEKSVCDVAGEMSWDITAKSWDDFPKPQKWFATGEAMAHLEHLYCKGVANRREVDGILLYSNK